MRIKFNIGDWSNDGHGRNQTTIIESNHPVETLQDAYLKSCEDLGFQFHRITGDEPADQIEMLVDYQDGLIPRGFFRKMLIEGVDLVNKHELETWEGTIHVYEDEIVPVILDFLSLNMPDDFKYEVISDDVPAFNGNWEKISTIGYGLFE